MEMRSITSNDNPKHPIVAGGVSGLLAAPLGGVMWVMEMVAIGNESFELNWEWSPTLPFDVVTYFGLVAAIAMFVGGLPGAALGAIGGFIIGGRPISLATRVATTAIGAITGLLIAVTPQVGLTDLGTAEMVGLGIAGAVAGWSAITIFGRLRDKF